MADIIVTDAQGLPEKAYLSIRVGDIRRQMQYKAGCKFKFDGESVPRHFIVDVFEKVGTTQVSLADLSRQYPDEEAEGKVEVIRNNGVSMNVALKVLPSAKASQANIGPGATTEKQPDTRPLEDEVKETKKAIRQQAAVKAKTYLEGHAVQKLLQGMVHTLLESQPEDPLDFMRDYLKDQHQQPLNPISTIGPGEASLVSELVQDQNPHWSSEPGLGNDEMPGFAVDGSEPLPDLAKHHNLLARVLRENEQLYERLSTKKTPSGVTLAKCIKVGIDNKGHQMIRSVGIAAADEFCYDTFRDVFGPIISRWHGDWPEEAVHPVDVDPLKVTNSTIDPSGHVLSVQIRVVRNLKGLKMPTACSQEERCEVERLTTNALLSLDLQRDSQGCYLPLRGSQTWAPIPGGMSEDEQRQLLSEQLLFDEPDSAVQLSAGIGRHWPHARGVYLDRSSKGKGFAVWINETDHMKFLVRRDDANIKEAFRVLTEAEGAVRSSLRQNQSDFAYDPHFGYLSQDPTQLGTGMTLSAVVKLPLLSAKPDFKPFCRRNGLHVVVFVGDREAKKSKGVWEVTGGERLGISEVEQVNKIIEGCQMLVKLEKQLEAGENVNLDQEEEQLGVECEENDDEWDEVAPGLGSDEYPGFPADECPDQMPDLSKHYSSMAEVLKDDSSIYDRLKALKTVNNISLAKCIKTGIDNPGHPMIKTVGLVAGDAECYDTFQELFDPVIQSKHPGVDLASVVHTTDMALENVISEPIDVAGDRVLSVRIRLSRNLSGMRMPIACTFDERREAEGTIVGALSKLHGDLQGEYFPLVNSESYAPKPQGMSPEDERTLRKDNFLFEEPDSEVQLSSGYGRDWPDARGVWVSLSRKVTVRVNEDDHVRIVTTQKGQDLKDAFHRACTVHDMIDAEGKGFAHHPRLGFLTVCPSGVGTCLIANVTLRIPFLCAQPEFRTLSQRLGVQVRPISGCMEVSNTESLGSSEVDQVNQVIIACKIFVELEAQLEAGEKIVWEVEPRVAALTPKKKHIGFRRQVSSRSRKDSTGTIPDVDFSKYPGLGDDEYPGFPADVCPDVIPDLSKNFSLMADVLKDDPSIYDSLRNLTTKDGVTFAKCIKTGVDNAGHPMIKTVGAVAGDTESYDTFAALFEPLIRASHKGSKFSEVGHITDMDPSKVASAQIDPDRNYVISVRISAQRNLTKLRMLPACSREERCQAEQVLCKAFEELSGEYDGSYFPLRGSTTCSEFPRGMSTQDQNMLDEAHLLFNEPDAALLLATGSGRHWPQARGVYMARSRSLAAWVNEEDHLRLLVFDDGADVQEAFKRFCMAHSSLLEKLRQEGFDFAWNEKLGYLSACPSNLGSGLRIEVTCRLPLLSQLSGFKAFCRSRRVQVRGAPNHARGIWEVCNMDKLGPSEVEQVSTVVENSKLLVELEKKLESGEDVDLAAMQ